MDEQNHMAYLPVDKHVASLSPHKLVHGTGHI